MAPLPLLSAFHLLLRLEGFPKSQRSLCPLPLFAVFSGMLLGVAISSLLLAHRFPLSGCRISLETVRQLILDLPTIHRRSEEKHLPESVARTRTDCFRGAGRTDRRSSVQFWIRSRGEVSAATIERADHPMSTVRAEETDASNPTTQCLSASFLHLIGPTHVRGGSSCLN